MILKKQHQFKVVHHKVQVVVEELEQYKQYAPLYNPDTGNPTMDAYMRRLRVNLGLPV
jgi:hypothetical protein